MEKGYIFHAKEVTFSYYKNKIEYRHSIMDDDTFTQVTVQ